MGHAPSIATKISSLIASPTTFQRTSKDISSSYQQTRKSLLAYIVDALHHSRRLQAKRIVRQHHHLIDQAGQGPVGESNASSGDRHHVVE